jgi:hypothetical protein
VAIARALAGFPSRTTIMVVTATSQIGISAYSADVLSDAHPVSGW